MHINFGDEGEFRQFEQQLNRRQSIIGGLPGHDTSGSFMENISAFLRVVGG